MTPKASDPPLDVTVIVPVHNGGADLSRCIDAIRAATGDSSELILVDDASSDGAVELARKSRPWIRVLRTGDSPVGPGVARNLAAASARGTWIVFVDADVLVHPDAIRRLLAPLQKAGPDAAIAATIGSYDDQPEARGIAATYANLRHHLVHQQARNPVPGFWTGLGAVRRDAFHSVGGFDAAFGRPSIEDVEFGLRLSAIERTIEVVPEANGTHLKAWTAIGLWKTDLFARGIPWGRAIATHPALASALNGSPRARIAILSISISALSAVLAIVAGAAGLGPAAIAFGVVALVGLGAWVLVEHELFGLMARHRGRATAIGGLGFHAIHHLTVPAACLFGVILERWIHRKAGRRVVWRNIAWLMVAWGPTLSLATAMVLFFLANESTAYTWLIHLESLLRDVPVGGFDPKYNYPEVERVVRRLPVLLVPTLMLAFIVTWCGPIGIRSRVAAAITCAIDALRMPGWLWLMSGLLSIIFLVGMWRVSDQPIRTDEAMSFVNHGLSHPFVILTEYGLTNNHILHSLLLWGSTTIFGIEPWAIRLPATLATLACIPLIAASVTRLCGVVAGLFAASIFVAIPTTLELATNARGYSIVIGSMLIMIAFLPMLERGRPGAGFGFVMAGVVGLMTTPVMAYPLGLLYCGLFLCRWRIGGLLTSLRCVPLVTATVLIGLCWYLPSWVFAAQADPVGNLGRLLVQGDGGRFAGQIHRLGFDLSKGWFQWTWPLPLAVSSALLALVVASFLRASLRGGAIAMLAVGGALGPILVFLMTNLASPPWWTMVWIPPYLVVLILAALVGPSRGDSTSENASLIAGSPPFAICALCFVAAAGATFASSPKRFIHEYPHRMWVGDPGPIAEMILQSQSADTSVFASRLAHAPLSYELLRRSSVRHDVKLHRQLTGHEVPPIALVISSSDGGFDSEKPGWNEKAFDLLEARDDLEVVQQDHGRFVVRLYGDKASP